MGRLKAYLIRIYLTLQLMKKEIEREKGRERGISWNKVVYAAQDFEMESVRFAGKRQEDSAPATPNRDWGERCPKKYLSELLWVQIRSTVRRAARKVLDNASVLRQYLG